MKLNQSLEGKNVKITCTDGEVFTGIVSDYIFPEDNEPEGIAAIDIDNCPQKLGESVNITVALQPAYNFVGIGKFIIKLVPIPNSLSTSIRPP